MLEFANIYVKVKEYKIDIQFIMKEGEENRSTEGPAFIKLVTLNDPPVFMLTFQYQNAE